MGNGTGSISATLFHSKHILLTGMSCMGLPGVAEQHICAAWVMALYSSSMTSQPGLAKGSGQNPIVDNSLCPSILHGLSSAAFLSYNPDCAWCAVQEFLSSSRFPVTQAGRTGTGSQLTQTEKFFQGQLFLCHTPIYTSKPPAHGLSACSSAPMLRVPVELTFLHPNLTRLYSQSIQSLRQPKTLGREGPLLCGRSYLIKNQ